MIRDISPVQWAAPGVARIDFGLLLSNLSQDPVELDSFTSIYAPIVATRATWTVAGNPNSIAIPDSTNQRAILIVLPRGNTQTCIIKGATSADASWQINPNGFLFTTFNGAVMPANLNAVVGGTITGASLYWW